MRKRPIPYTEGAGDISSQTGPDNHRYVALIDDEPNILSSLKRLGRGTFTKKPYGVVFYDFESGDALFDKLDKNQLDLQVDEFDAVVTDYNMDGMNGRDTIERLRSHRYEGHVFVFSTLDESVLAGLDGVTLIQKPNSTELIARLEEYLDSLQHRNHRD